VEPDVPGGQEVQVEPLVVGAVVVERAEQEPVGEVGPATA
jgi:hypothetical protein